MIYTAHGVVENYSRQNMCHLNFLDRSLFEKFLEKQQNYYVSLEHAIKEKGRAFTIDDSTYAALDMAEILIDYGHQVTLFVNAYHIEEQIKYWFSIANFLLENTSINEIIWNKNVYSLTSFKEKLIFRADLKRVLSLLDTEKECHNLLNQIFQTDVKGLDLPKYLCTITKKDLLLIQKKGVDIQNHGWSHKQLKKSSSKKQRDEIFYGKNWLYNFLNINSRFYAVPFGEAFPANGIEDLNLYDFWFLQNNSLGFKPISEKIRNRISFSL